VKSSVAVPVLPAPSVSLTSIVCAPSASPLGNTLTLELLNINYDLSTAVMKKTVFVDADIRATAAAGGNTFATTYRAHQEQEVAFLPSPALSQRLVNETLSNALSRALADPQLMAVLTQHATR